MAVTENQKGMKVDKTFRVDAVLWDKFLKIVNTKGLKITFVMDNLIKKYVEENKEK